MHKKYLTNLNVVKNEWVTIVLFSIMWFVFYGLSYINHYSVDDYSQIYIDLKELTHLAVISGRGIAGLILILYNAVFGQLPVNSQQIAFSLIFAIFSLCSITVYLSYREKLSICKNGQISITEKIILFFSVTFIFYNPFFVDWFQFSDVSLTFAVGLFFTVTSSVLFFTQWEIKIKRTVISFVLMVLAMFCYQPLGAYFFLIGLPYLFFRCIKEKRLINRNFVLSFLVGCFIYVLAALVNLIFIAVLFGSNTRGSENSLYEKIVIIIKSQYRLWLNNFGLTNNYIFLTCFVILLVTLTICISKNKRKGFILFYALLFNITIFVVIFAPSLKESWMSPRTITAFLGLPSILLLFILALVNRDLLKYFSHFIILICTILFFLFAINTQKVYTDLIVTNSCDKQEVFSILSIIENYEVDSGIKVEKLAFASDKWPSYYYYGVKSTHDLNIRALLVSWSRQGIFKLHGRRDFSIEEMPISIYDNYFKDKNWDKFSPQQIIINGNTAYICVY